MSDLHANVFGLTIFNRALALDSLRNRQWAIFKASALKGQGLYEGLDWLVSAIKQRRGVASNVNAPSAPPAAAKT